MTRRSRQSRMPGGARAAIVCVLVVFVAALAVPVANANVQKKHRAAYRTTVTMLSNMKSDDVATCNAYAQDLYDTAQDIQNILSSDPVDHDSLVNEEHYAESMVPLAQTYKAAPEQLEAGVDNFNHVARKWFATDADKIKFGKACHKVATAASQIQTVYDELGVAWGWLAVDPPAVDTARGHAQTAANLADKANASFKAGFSGLKALQ